ncbi:hypothetical protein OROHE_007453 [Orobanche hederae]
MEKKEEVQDTVALESGDDLENLGQPVGVRPTAPIGRFKVKEVEKRLPLSCKFVYNHADKIMYDINHVRIQLDEALFGVKRHTWLLKGNIFDFMEMKAIGQAHITIYMGHLFKYLKEHDSDVPFALWIPHVPGDGDMSGNGRLLIERLNHSTVDSIFLIPFNTGALILIVINENKDKVYFLDSLGNMTRAVRAFNASKGKRWCPPLNKSRYIPQGELKMDLLELVGQPDCGILCIEVFFWTNMCLLNFHRRSTASDSKKDCIGPTKIFILPCMIKESDLTKPSLEGTKITYGGGPVRDKYYSQAQYDEVLDDWSQFVYSHLI